MGMVRDRLGDNIDRVGIVEQPRRGANHLHVFDNSLCHMDRAQSHKEAAWPLCFLPDYAMFERDALIQVTSLKAACSKARQHGIAIAQSVLPVSCRSDGNIQAPGACHLASNGLHNSQALLIQVDQHNLGAVKVFSLVNKRGQSSGRARAASSNICQFDTRHIYFSFYRDAMYHVPELLEDAINGVPTNL